MRAIAILFVVDGLLFLALGVSNAIMRASCGGGVPSVAINLVTASAGAFIACCGVRIWRS